MEQQNDVMPVAKVKNGKKSFVKKYLLDKFKYKLTSLTGKNLDECCALIEAMNKPTEYITYHHTNSIPLKLVHFAYISNIYRFEPTNLRDKKIIEHVIDDTLQLIMLCSDIEDIIDEVYKDSLVLELINNFEYLTSLECASGIFVHNYYLSNYVKYLKENNYKDIDEQIISLFDHDIRCNDYALLFETCNDKNINIFKKLIDDGCSNVDIKLMMYYYDKKMYDEMCKIISKGLHNEMFYIDFCAALEKFDYIQHYVKYLAGCEDNENTYMSMRNHVRYCSEIHFIEDVSLKLAVKLYRENEILKQH